MPHYIKVSQTASTNTYLSRLAATLPGGTVIYTPCSNDRPSKPVTSST